MTRRSRTVLTLAVLCASAAVAPQAHAHGLLTQAAAFSESACGGVPMSSPRVITGTFDQGDQGSYVMVPFDVPAGTTQVRVKYCWDDPDSPEPVSDHTLDLGLWDAREGAVSDWGPSDFRGWGGSSHPDVQITPQGFAPDHDRTRPRNTPGYTTRGFVPGPIQPGTWAAELGVAAVAGPVEGDSDGRVHWRVEVELSSDPSFDDAPYQPAAYDSTPANSQPGWYKGDLHVHAEHSAWRDATMAETFGYAFAPRPSGAGLDFITLSDYVTTSAWGEIGRHQPDHPGKLIVRSAEVITYRGHTNNHGSVTYVDHRTGPVYLRRDDGSLELLRPARPARDIFAAVHAAGGWTQINHPTIFPSIVPPFRYFCRGCPWDYSDAETDYRQVDAIEVSTGPPGLRSPELGPNPFTPLAIQFYEHALSTGARIAAVGASDSHNAGRTPDPVTQAPIGTATTVVFAPELSEAGVREAVRRRHTYVKLFRSDGPDLRFEATTPPMTAAGRDPAIMGDVLRSTTATFTAKALGADATHQLLVVKDGVPVLFLPVTGASTTHRFPALGAGRYRLQLMRGTSIVAVSSPIWLDPNAAPGEAVDGDLPRGSLLSAKVKLSVG